VHCGIGSWGARCLNLAPYVAGTRPTDGATAPPEGANVAYAPEGANVAYALARDDDRLVSCRCKIGLGRLDLAVDATAGRVNAIPTGVASV